MQELITSQMSLENLERRLENMNYRTFSFILFLIVTFLFCFLTLGEKKIVSQSYSNLSILNFLY